MSAIGGIEIDKSAISIVSLYDDSGDKDYWHSKTPRERLEALEVMRQINYGYDPTTIRLQRVFEVVQADVLFPGSGP